MIAKRLLDILASGAGLIMLAPFLFLIALWIRIDSRGPAIFKQARVGRGEKLFQIWKFRSMLPDSERKGLQLTLGQDPRITRAGRFLRRYKLDELPQLINVFRGDMSLVGPRPEVPRYVMHYTAEQRERILSVRPGITDPASIEFVDENDLLRASDDPERTYIETILPRKLSLYEAYLQTRSFWGDVQLILKTVSVSIGFGVKGR